VEEYTKYSLLSEISESQKTDIPLASLVEYGGGSINSLLGRYSYELHS
jgi:hypothetical protein